MYSSLGLGHPEPNNPAPRRVTSGDQQKTYVMSVETAKAPTNKRKAPLTQDNAYEVFTKYFDMDVALERIREATMADSAALLDILTTCVKESEVVSFSNVSLRHLKNLGIEKEDAEIDKEAMKAVNLPDSPANRSVQHGSLQLFLRHFNVAKESGCRCLIDQYLFYAIVYAQSIIDKDEGVRATLTDRCGFKHPHLAVFPELAIPLTRITCEQTQATYVFHGLLDYGICFIKQQDAEMLSEGILGIDNLSQVLSGILEAKTEAEMKFGDPQIIAQILSILELTQRDAFTGALTNGAYWRFFVARITGKELHVNTTATFKVDKNAGLIVELLKDMMIYKISPLFKF